MPAGNTYPFDAFGGTTGGTPPAPWGGYRPSSATPSAGGAGSHTSHFGAGDWASIGANFAPLVLSAFMGNKSADQAEGDTAQLSTLAKSLFGSGAQTTEEGRAALAPVLQYLAKVAGGDPAALLSATAPERGRVLDQYDTARKAAQFQPRGGGQASASATLESSKASALTAETSMARTEGVKTAASLGTNLSYLGTQESAAGTSALEASIRSSQANAARTDEQNGMWGQVLGAAVASLPYLAMIPW